MTQADQPSVAGDRDNPGLHPAEVQPGQGDFDQPGGSPPEFAPGGGDTDRPGAAPAEIPAQPGVPSAPD